MPSEEAVIQPPAVEPPQWLFSKPPLIIHVGNPAHAAPHRDLSMMKRLHSRSPETRFIAVLWKEDEKDAFDKEIASDPEQKKELISSILWATDTKLQVELLGVVDRLVGAQIATPRWLICPAKHESRELPDSPNDICPTCGMGVALLAPYKDKFAAFARIFQKCISLCNFDIGSAQVLFERVDPRRNVLLNMRHAFGGRTVKDLRGSGKGKTAYVVAAGPSLEDQLDDLKRLSETGIVVCVGRSYKLLRAAGVKVHYTYSVEMFDWDSAIFSELTHVDDTVLLHATVCAPATVDAWPGERICVLDAETASILKRDDFILGGNSVSHHMLNFAAQILDADEIVLVGCDLAYTKMKTHAEGTTPKGWPEDRTKADEAYHEEDYWAPCSGEDPLNPECHRMQGVMTPGGFSPTEGAGIEVRSSGSYSNFAALFEVLIEKHKKKVLNACPNGHLIAGTELVDLKEYKK